MSSTLEDWDAIVDAETKRAERNNERDKEKQSKKQNNVGQATKGKDLSHVPCKFFKVGQCTAGSSCVFSHHVNEPGEAKEVCAWFVKGNCKFAHKCALAHILPGQPMSMDRKNKKAAQQQNAAAGGKTEKDPKRDRSVGPTAKAVKDRPAPSLLTTRLSVPNGLRAPMSISKATMSPSAPAPVLRDADFGPKDLDEDAIKAINGSVETTATAWRQETISTPSATTSFPKAISETKDAESSSNAESPEARRPSPLPLHTPSAPRGYFANAVVDFGPVGSPPRSSPMTSGTQQATSPGGLAQGRTNGFSPGTSPSRANQHIPNSPFSAPVSHNPFSNFGGEWDTQPNNDFDYQQRSGLASSLGATNMLSSRPWDIRSLPRKQPSGLDGEDDRFEDLLPSSLNELLTPAERQRRESRNNGLRPNFDYLHHRHSHSVPALSLMDNMKVKNIWNDEMPSHQADQSRSVVPSSFSDRLSPNPLSTSNVSTGFLSGLQIHRPNVTQRSISDHHPAPPLSASPSKPSPFSSRPAYERTGFGFQHTSGSQPHDELLSTQLGHLALSPSTRALESHAPGTSLPQGLAAGYSRIHALPPSIYSALSPPNTAGLEDANRFGPSRTATGNASPQVTPMQSNVGSVASRRTRSIAMPLSSPLAGPVITNDLDDDGLFDMDDDHQN